MKSAFSFYRGLGAALMYSWLAGGVQASPVITEIMASNAETVFDEDGTASDWVEIFNPDEAAANLSGWRLTDDAASPYKWVFPEGTILPPGGFLRVWASGKNRTGNPDALHTNFSLSSGGEYLALFPAGALEPVSAFAPAFPAMPEDVSYGIPFVRNAVTENGAMVSVLAPAVESPGWEDRAFAGTAAWETVPSSVGFGIPAVGFFVEEQQSSKAVTTLAEATALLASGAAEDRLTGLRPVVNFAGSGAPDGRYGGGIPFLHSGAPEKFAFRATTVITLPTGGQWTFHVHAPGGFRLTFDGATMMQFTGIREATDAVTTRTLPSGQHVLQIVYFGGTGSHALEISAAQGSHPGFSEAFALVGDRDGGGIAAVAPADSGLSNVVTDLASRMPEGGTSVYARLPFLLTDPAEVETLELTMAYNDGVVVWLNGTGVLRRNAPEMVRADSLAAAVRSVQESLQPESFSLSEFRHALVAGENVLAFQVLKSSLDDDSLYLAPQVSATRRQPGPLLFFQQPTPLAENTTAGVLGFTAAPGASPGRGYYEVPASVTLSSETPGAEIRYTTDGSLPGPGKGTLYTGPVTVSRTTVLRAAATLEDFAVSSVVTNTYLFPEDIIRQGTGAPDALWPAPGAVNGQVIQYGMDQGIVNSTNPAIGGAAQMVSSLRSLPAVCLTAEVQDLFDPTRGIYVNADGHGRSWERPGAIELIGEAESPEPGFEANCGLRMRGGVSRRDSNPKHGWRIFFRKEYGPGKLHYPVFGEDGSDVFDAFDVQCAQNYTWSRDGSTAYNPLREIWSRDTQLAMGQPSTRGRFVHLYVNGNYWGLHQIQERPIASYGEAELGGKAEDYDVIKHAGLDGGHTVEATDGYFTTLPDGTPAAWQQLWSASRAAYFISRNRNPASPYGAKTSSEWEKLAAYYKLQGLEADGRTRSGEPVLLDPDNLIDYMILLLFTKNSDSSVSAFYENARPNNFYCLRNRLGEAGFVSINHDAEHTLEAPGAADRWGPWQTDTGNFWNNINYSNPQYLHQDLSFSGEYKMRFADRLHRHFHHGGVLETSRNLARYDVREAEISQAIMAESARWGDAQATPARTALTWAAARTSTRNWFASRNAAFLDQARARGFYPSTEPPLFSQRGGVIGAGEAITISNPNAAGVIHYTTDGSDPRLAGGAESGGFPYTGPVVMNRPGWLKARVLNGREWSALEEAEFGFGLVPASAANLVVSEFCYDPAGPGTTEESGYEASDFEFIELQNISDFHVDMKGVAFTHGVGFGFGTEPGAPQIPPGGRLIVSPRPDAFAVRYGLNRGLVAGPFSGKLNNEGEVLGITAADGSVIKAFAWGVRTPWPSGGAGHSLVLQVPASNPDHNNPANWRRSAFPDGQPGQEKTLSYAAWKLAEGVTDDAAVPWNSGLSALAAYALGGSAARPGDVLLPSGGLELIFIAGEGLEFATFSYRCRLAAVDVLYTLESSADLSSGSWGPADFSFRSETDHGDGTATRRYRSRLPVDPDHPIFVRLRLSLRE